MSRLYLRNFHTRGVLEAGCDEAGRGCLAGPVYAAAVILPSGFKHPLLNDSKKMAEQERQELRTYIEQKSLAWAVASATNREIDEINILHASFLAMHRAIKKLEPAPETLLIDGNRFNAYPGLPHHCIVKGDGRYKNMAAASVLAKTYRDDFMKEMARQYPHYCWHDNKGYGTTSHRLAIIKHGRSPLHRLSFRLGPDEKPFS